MSSWCLNLGLEICVLHDFKVLGRTYLEMGADVKSIGTMTQQPLLHVAEHTSLEMRELLLEYGRESWTVGKLEYSSSSLPYRMKYHKLEETMSSVADSNPNGQVLLLSSLSKDLLIRSIAFTNN